MHRHEIQLVPLNGSHRQQMASRINVCSESGERLRAWLDRLCFVPFGLAADELQRFRPDQQDAR